MKVWYKREAEGSWQRVVIYSWLSTVNSPTLILAEVKAAFMEQESSAQWRAQGGQEAVRDCRHRDSMKNKDFTHLLAAN